MLEFVSLNAIHRQLWDEIVGNACFSDFFHLSAYHKVCAEYDGIDGEMVLYSDGPYFIALPLLIRRIETVNGSSWGGDLMDATSVYGYSGPLASHPVEALPAVVIQRFQAALHRALADRRIVSLFCRLHPMMAQARLIVGLGSGAVPVGQTVSIDLTLPEEEQWRGFRRNHRHDIAKLVSLGMLVDIDRDGHHLDQFLRLYQRNKRRLGADPWYYFNADFMRGLRDGLAQRLFLFLCTYKKEIIGGLMVSLFRKVAHCFLAAPNLAYDRLPSMKLIFNAARLWACDQGAHTLFLGGGVGSKSDSLLHFKAGFSDRRHDFSVWRWVIVPEHYAALCAARGCSTDIDAASAFPAYRFSAKPSETEPTQETKNAGLW